jgi:hypothetical protein
LVGCGEWSDETSGSGAMELVMHATESFLLKPEARVKAVYFCESDG